MIVLNKFRFWVFLIFIFQIQIVEAQNYDWLANTKSVFGESFTSSAIDSSGNIYVIGQFDRQLLFNTDTSRFTGNTNSSFIAKYNENATLIWVREFKSCGFEKIAIDFNGSILVFGSARDTLTTSIGQIFGSFANQTCFLLRFNGLGNTIQLKDLGFNTSNVSMLNLKFDKFGDLFFVGHFISNFSIGGTYISKTGTFSDGILIKMSSNLLNVVWWKSASRCVFYDLTFDESQNIYLVGVLTGISSNPTSIFSSISITATQNDGFIARLNNSGIFSWVKKIGGADSDQSFSVDYSHGKLFFCGVIVGSATFQSNTIYTNPQNSSNGFLAATDTLGNILRVKLGFSNSSLFSKIILNYDGDIMLVGIFNGFLSFGSNVLSDNPSNCLFISKFDTSLNCIWSKSLKSTGDGNNVVYTKKREYYFSGTMYSSSMQFGPFYRFFNYTSNNGFLLKISDITITCTPQLEPKYCSEDSLIIHYQTTGKFNKGNTFTAFLSNSVGGFDTSYLIGSRLDTQSNAIYCKIPNTLIGSNSYKIRIISDSPSVLSFFDTTSYRIQPKPIAIAGSDTFICYGESIELGDIKTIALSYDWQPASCLIDGSTKQPNTIKYLADTFLNFVLLAKNQHCFAIDTVSVLFQQPLSILLPADTLICKGVPFSVLPIVEGGRDSIYRQVNWFKQINDSLVSIKANFDFMLNRTDSFYAILKDECSIPDTSKIEIRVVNNRPLLLPKDSVICMGQQITLAPSNFYPDTNGFKIRWTNMAFQNLSHSDTLKPSSSVSSGYYFISENLCSGEPDTTYFLCQVRDHLSLKLMEDTTICKGQKVNVSATLYGGKPWSYKLDWDPPIADSGQLFIYDSQSSTYRYQFSFLANSSQKYIASLTDACSSPVIDSLIVLNPDSLILSVFSNRVCKGSPIQLKSMVKGGKNPIIFQWMTYPDKVLIDESETFYLAAAQDTIFHLRVSDACKVSDSLNFNYETYPIPTAEFSIDTLYKNIGFTELGFTNLSFTQNPSIYYWDFGDGMTSTSKDPSHRYTTTGTYEIKLVVMNANSCLDTTSKLANIQIALNHDFYLPNAISLNGDGINDTFSPQGNFIESWSVKIYNRWNQLVYAGDQNTLPFSGLDIEQNELPGGVYYYEIKVLSTFKVFTVKNGTLTLIK